MNKLIVIAGPTAVGKSDIAIKLAKRLNGEIVSADSMQVYRYMDIGSAKVTKEEMQGIPHHLIDVLDPAEDFNAFLFTKMAGECIEDINARGKVPILTGGTGFYIRALCYGNDFSESAGADPEIYDRLEKEASEKGPDVLFDRLKKVDPLSCEIVHPNNIKRVIRALAFYEETGRPISTHNSEMRERPPAYVLHYFVITDERKKLYERIDARVDKMMEAGLLDEVRRLKAMGLSAKQNNSMQGIGYKELLMYLDGKISLPEAVDLIKKGSRHYAKRQLTWFKRERDAIWIDRSLFSPPDEDIQERITEHMILSLN